MRRVHVAAMGAATAVGLLASTTAAAVRAGICRIAEHSYLVDRDYRPFMTAEAKWLGEVGPGHARMLALARPALQQVLDPLLAQGRFRGLRIGLYLGLPSPRAGLSSPQLDQVVHELRAMLPAGRELPTTVVERFHDDHAACLVALQAAERLLLADELDACILGGVDSFLSAATLDALDGERRLLTEDHPHGFAPGEAAAFCMLLTARGCARLGLPSMLELESLAITTEPAPLGGAAVCTGMGLRRAFEVALAELGSDSERVDFMICDLNGEPYRADELAFALVRTSNRFWRPGRFRAPADSWGDVGAASGTLFLILAACAWQRGYAAGPRVLLSTSAASGPHRAVAIVRAPNSSPPQRTSWPSRSTSTG